MQNEAKFWDNAAAKYFRQPIKDEEAYKMKLEMTREHLAPNFRVLEFGCGTGGTAIKHASYVQSIHGVDISDKMLDFARQQAREKCVENATFQCSDIADFDAPKGSYEAVLGMSILHLVRDREAMIAKVHKLLKPGGVFITSTVCLAKSHWYLRPLLWAGHKLGKLPYVSFLTPNALENELVAGGFRTIHHWVPGKSSVVFMVSERAAPPWETA